LGCRAKPKYRWDLMREGRIDIDTLEKNEPSMQGGCSKGRRACEKTPWGSDMKIAVCRSKSSKVSGGKKGLTRGIPGVSRAKKARKTTSREKKL